MVRSVLPAALAMLLLATSVACGPLTGGERESPFASASDNRVLVLVENRNREEVIVEVDSPSGRQELGRVSARGRAQFGVDWERTQEFRFRINLVAGSRHTLRVGSVSPGDQVELLVAESINNSFARRR